MPRYYYTNPHHAALMMENFGMRLQVFPTEEQAAEYESNEPWDWEDSTFEGAAPEPMISDALEFLKAATDRAYVHPDSVHILEFEEYDWIDTPLGLDEITYTTSNYIHGDRYGYPKETAKIIWRDGKPFFTPEVEDASS